MNDFPNQVRAYVTDDDLEGIEGFCEDNGYSKSAGMRQLIRLGITANERNQSIIARARLVG